MDIDLPGHLNNLTADQRENLNTFWRLILQYPDPALLEELWNQLAIDNADILLLRFLRARKWDVDAACAMFLQALKWRQAFQVQQMMQQGEAAIPRPLLESGKGVYWGVDRAGRLVSYFRPRLHDWRAQSLTDTCRQTVYQTEIGRRLFTPGSETLTVIFDMQGLTAWSLDMGCIRFVISCFQEHYPESLGPCLIVNAPWIFFSFYGMVKGLICEEVRNKIKFLNDYEQLKEFIAPEMLLKEYGGENPYCFEYIPAAPQMILDGEEQCSLLIEKVEPLKLRAQQVATALIAKGERDEVLLQELTEIYKDIDALTAVDSLYHRLGVLKDGVVTWSK